MTYDPPTGPPSGGEKPGAVALENYVTTLFGLASLGIYNPRDVCGNPWPNWHCAASAHAEGRAVDFAANQTDGDQLVSYLIEYADRWGIQEVIWWAQRWTNQDRRWRPYRGRSDHKDHVHVALNRAGAEQSAPQRPKQTGGTKPMWVIRLVEGDKVVDPTQYVTDFVYRRPIADGWELDQLVAAGCIQRDLDHRLAKRIPIAKG